MLKVGVRWRVGDGRSIRVMKDPWLPTPSTFLPISWHEEMPGRVEDLIAPGGKWKKDVIERCFDVEEAGIILGMPLSKFGCGDKLIWHYTWNELYTVKSGYLVAQEINRNGELGRKGVGQSSSDQMKDPVWSTIWQLDVPPKLQHFIWHGCKNILVVRMNLQRRGVRLETNAHIVMMLSKPRSPIQLDIAHVEGNDFLDCWKWLCKKSSDSMEQERFLRWVVCGLWRIWKCRNKVVFDKIVVDPREAVELLSQHWSDIELVAGEGGQKTCRQVLQVKGVGGNWSKPPFGMIKVNCDGAWCSQTGKGGFGWVARDFVGIFKAAGGVGSVPCQSSLMAKAEAMKETLLACVERGFEMVQVEFDSKNLVDILNGALQNETTINGIVWDILQLKQQLWSVEFLFTSHACNGAAHQVATFVTLVGGVHVWDCYEPEWLLNVLASDVNISIRI